MLVDVGEQPIEHPKKAQNSITVQKEASHPKSISNRGMFCGCKYTLVQKQHGYDSQLRKQAIRLYIDGMNLRRTARHWAFITVWVQAHLDHLPKAPQPQKIKTAEMDELFTFIGKKKTKSI